MTSIAGFIIEMIVEIFRFAFIEAECEISVETKKIACEELITDSIFLAFNRNRSGMALTI